MAFTQNTQPTLTKQPQFYGCSLGQPLAWKQLAVGGTSGTKITSIIAASTDSATKIVSVAVARQIPLTSISNASPAVFTATSAHGLVTQDVLFLTGTLGTGLVAWDNLTTGTTYNVIAAGLTATVFEVALGATIQGGGTTAINTSGASSGTLVAYGVKVLGSTLIAVTSGTDGSTASTNMLSNITGLPVDADGQPYIFLASPNDALYVGNTVATTANKAIFVSAVGADF